MSFFIQSEAIKNGKIADKYGKRSSEVLKDVPQISFPLTWGNYPPETKSFAIVFLDNDNIPEEGFSWVHWLVANIPVEVTSLEEDAGRQNKDLLQGKNTWATQYDKLDDVCNRYGGPAPMVYDHEYEITIYALSDMLNLKPGFYYNELLKEIRGKVLDESTIYGVYSA